MTGFRFEMDPNWERNLRREMKSALTDIAKDYQRAVDRVHRQYQGKPVSVVKPALKRALSGANLNDKQLTEYAKVISDGGRIQFDVK